ncbi:MAG: hypothetical protein MRJ92_13500 [Nitrospira sp.]|nr:hypothetical protein [Nitrospira sp.]
MRRRWRWSLSSASNVRLTPCPKPPQILDGWLKPGWQSVDEEAEMLKSRNFQDKEGDYNRLFRG